MRITTLLITGLFMACSTKAMASPRSECMEQLKETKADKASVDAMLAYSRRFIEHVDYCRENHPLTLEDLPRTQTFHNSPDYEFKAWEANEDYKRDIEAINRDYDLRRAGVLP